jgi:acyl-CoA dehydrogenase
MTRARPEATLRALAALARDVGQAVTSKLSGLDETVAARRALEALGAARLTAWTVPERDGGAKSGGLAPEEEVSVRALCAVREELAWHHGMLDVVFVLQGLGSYPVALAGKDALRRKVLPLVARGRLVPAFALTEPEAGSSLGDIATSAEKKKRGWILDGRKTFISNAGVADFYTVLARTSGKPGESEGLSMFYVPASARGIQISRFEVMAPHPIGDVILNDVEVQADHLLGEEGQGLEIALGTLGRFRTSVAAAANGFARRAFEESRQHLSARKQFGRPLSSFQSLRFDLAEMDVRLRAAQLLVAEAAAAVDRGERATSEVARAKLFATENASWICDRAVQHFGGLGVKRGSVVERLFRDVRALRIYEGTSEIQKLVLAKEILGG